MFNFHFDKAGKKKSINNCLKGRMLWFNQSSVCPFLCDVKLLSFPCNTHYFKWEINFEHKWYRYWIRNNKKCEKQIKKNYVI